jgi:hypothetical protein
LLKQEKLDADKFELEIFNLKEALLTIPSTAITTPSNSIKIETK